jgi:nucleoside phosphorylase
MKGMRQGRQFFWLVLGILWLPAALAGRYVIGGQYAFGPEGDVVITAMQKEGGHYWKHDLPSGRVLHVLDFAHNPGVRLVYMETRMGMENATQASVLMATLPVALRPEVVLHSGICGNAGPGMVGDIYLPRYFVLANLGQKSPQQFQPWANESYDPKSHRKSETTYFPADQRLIGLADEAFARYSHSPAFLDLQAQVRPEGPAIALRRGFVGASSNWFVADSSVLALWHQLYDIRPAQGTAIYPGEQFYGQAQATLPLATIDMEAAAAAKVFREFDIPFAAARYPSDSASETANAEWERYYQHAAAIGGGFVWQWITQIAQARPAARDVPDGVGQKRLGHGS